MFTPSLDPDFLPAVLWNRAYRKSAEGHPRHRHAAITLSRPDETSWRRELLLLPDEKQFAGDNWLYVERMVKYLLWAWGGNRVALSGAPELVLRLQACYCPGGERHFDAGFMGETCFRAKFEVVDDRDPAAAMKGTRRNTLGRHLDGCRIVFDLGGSDRKCAALIDGEVVFSE